MSRSAEFDRWRPLLLSIALCILDSASEAEDATHRTWLTYRNVAEEPASGKEFLTAEITRISVGILRESMTRRARPPRPQPLPDGPPPATGDASRPRADTVDPALTLLERLPPLQRAVFVLREVFGCGLAQTASAVGCSETMCLRLAAAVPGADGPAPLWPPRVTGAEQVARLLVAMVPALDRVGVTMLPQQVERHPGAVFRDRNGELLAQMALDVHDGRIQTIRWVTGPDRPTTPPAPPEPERGAHDVPPPAAARPDTAPAAGPHPTALTRPDAIADKEEPA